MGWDFFQKKPIVPYDGNDLGMIDPWLEREQPTRYTDKHSTVNLIGPAFNLTRYAGQLTARIDLEATPGLRHGQFPGLQRLFGRS